MTDLEDELNTRIEVEITDTFDLHSFRPDEIGDVVRSYLAEAHARGFDSIRIIHGKGIGAQRKAVRNILGQDPRVLEVTDPPENAGGWGATCATLKPSSLKIE